MREATAFTILSKTAFTRFENSKNLKTEPKRKTTIICKQRRLNTKNGEKHFFSMFSKRNFFFPKSGQWLVKIVQKKLLLAQSPI